jgi:hypothetical protein
MARKRTSLDILDDVPVTPGTDPAVSPAPANETVVARESPARPVQKATKIPQGLQYRPPGGTDGPVWDKVRDIAHYERRSLNSILTEGLNLFLQNRGQPSIGELIGEEEYQRAVTSKR